MAHHFHTTLCASIVGFGPSICDCGAQEANVSSKLKGVYCQECNGPVDCFTGLCIVDDDHISGWYPCHSCNNFGARSLNSAQSECFVCDDVWLLPIAES